jgi:hypothetical protein
MRGTPVAPAASMRRSRSTWVRVLQLSELDDDAGPGAGRLEDLLLDVRVHARSRFRSLARPARFALYSVHTAEGAPGLPLGPGEHTLVAVREFRRIPLDASSLALTVFRARAGRAVAVVAALADFVERAVNLYQPGYLLLAHSLDDPRTSVLLTAVRDAAGLGAAAPAAFSLDELLGELTPMLFAAPECYAYCPERDAVTVAGLVSPRAV